MRIAPVPTGLQRAAGWSWNLLLCAVAAAVLIFILWYLRVIVIPLIVAITIAPALTPVANRLRRAGLGRAAPGVALLVGIAIVAGLVALVTTSVAQEYDELAAAVREGVRDVTGWLEDEPFNLSLEGDRDLNETFGDAWGQVSGYLISGVRSGVGVITGVVLAVALLYFLLRDGARFWRRIVGRFPPDSQASLDRAGNRAWDVLGGFVRGTALIAAIDATLIGIGLWILGVPLAFALAVLIFLGAFVPFVGAAISGLLAVLVALADGGVTTAVIALAIVLGVQFIEGNVLQPIIQSRTVDLHPAVILLAVAAGGSLFGILGAYLAVPVTAVVFAVATSLEAEGVIPAGTAAPEPGERADAVRAPVQADPDLGTTLIASERERRDR